MIGKLLVKLKTAFALKSNDALRVSEAYKQAKTIGVLSSYDPAGDRNGIDDLIEKFESDQKKVSVMTYVSSSFKLEEPSFAYFNEKDLNNKGNWSKEIVDEFRNQPFDFLVSLDWNVNKYTQNILASSKAKCRVGRFEEGTSQYFELMINPSDDNYGSFLEQLYHYLTNVRNGE